ncbi:MAG: efflux RND transporter periplasmic adaptor subunit [Parahaliea sp.]
MRTVLSMALGVLIGVLIGAVTVTLWPSTGNESTDDGGLAVGDVGQKPLYWVAPMDPNYRRDGPGKSPMGMDLVPVYADAADGRVDAGPGTIRIAPQVLNNLGVRSAPVVRARWQSHIQTVGYVRYDEDRLLHIHPRVSGWVEKLYIKAVGDPVEQGQALYALYSPELVNAQEELLIALRRKNSALIEAASARLQALQLGEAFIAGLRRSGKVQQRVTFYARQGGVVENLSIREGFYVQPGTTIMSIGQLDEVWVEAEVFERQVAELKAGLAVSMRLDYLPGRSWEGVVDYVYPDLDPKLRTLRVRLRFANPDGLLRPNMFAQVSIHGEPGGAVLTIPREALIRTGHQQRVVLALGEGRFKSVAIETGRIGEERVEVLSGLAEGDEVVTSAQFMIDSESSKYSDFQRLQAPADRSQMDRSQMNHSQMDHSQMDHSQMKHGEMDHSTMSHSQEQRDD